MATTPTSAVGTSSLDVNSIVSQLMTVERQPIAKLNTKEAGYQAKLSAFGSVKGAVAGFQTAILALNSPSKFNTLNATSSDATVVSASASSIAVAGTYSLDVTSLAQAQKLVATGQTSSTAAIGTGTSTTVTFDFGTISGGSLTSGVYSGATFTSNGNGTQSVTIDSSNNSLQGIRDAINAADIGVTATIVNDGSATPYRLVLSSDNNGVSNSMNITVSGETALSDLLTNNPGSVAAVAGSNTVASGTKVAAAAAGTTAGTLAAGALIANTSAGAISIGAVTLGTDAATNGAAIALAINTALAAAAGGAAVNGTAAADGAGVITITAGSSAITLSMGSFAADSATATANQAALAAQTGFDAAQLGTQAIGTQKMSESVTAQNAVFEVNGIPISKTSNTVTDVIQGVTFTLGKENSTATLTVAQDTAGISGSISSFVTAYNDLATTLKNVSAYDAASKQAATLQGDSTVRTLQTQLRSMLSTAVVGASGALTMLANIGITAQKDGTLAIDQTKLDSVLASNFSDVASLFTSVGKATDSLVSFNNATTATKAGSYAVNITQLAAKHSVTGNLIVPASGNVVASGSTMSVALDGVAATSVTLTAGTYTNSELAAMIQSAINGTSAFSSAESSVAVTIDGSGYLNIVSSKYGSSTYGITMADGAGTAISSLVGALATTTAGVDVVGSIGGASAAGYGQVLSAVNGDQEGLSIIVNGGALGDRGTLNYSQGYASILSQWSTSVLSSDGSIASVTSGINNTIKDIGKRRSDLETRLIEVEKRYRAQFTALDAMLTSMNNTSLYLSQQLSSISNLN
jgi:flagellar hook-associated protein 2